MTTTLSTAKLIRLLFICVAIAALALTGAAYAVSGHAVQHHVAAAGTPKPNPYEG
jgi:hypothetical protein